MDYQAKCELYKEEKIFNTAEIKITVDVTTYDTHRAYILSNIGAEFDNIGTGDFNDICDKVNASISDMTIDEKHSKSHHSWSVFYAFKEIIDLVEANVPDGYNLYFRGQGGGWDIKPTLFRSGSHGGYSDEFRQNYDDIYRSISQKFPGELKYCSEFGSDERATNLAELQHYGLGTPLVDVTENPFIALLFMTTAYNSDTDNPNPQLDIFYIKANGCDPLFQNVAHQQQNVRISAQKGAFLNFEKLDESLLSGKNKISRICVKVEYENHNDPLDDDLPEPDMSSIDPEPENKSSQEIALETAMTDISSKLKSFHYTADDLFPDFYKYLESMKIKYSDTTNEEQQWNKRFMVKKLAESTDEFGKENNATIQKAVSK